MATQAHQQAQRPANQGSRAGASCGAFGSFAVPFVSQVLRAEIISQKNGDIFAAEARIQERFHSKFGVGAVPEDPKNCSVFHAYCPSFFAKQNLPVTFGSCFAGRGVYGHFAMPFGRDRRMIGGAIG
jgi:hypothetical protein